MRSQRGRHNSAHTHTQVKLSHLYISDVTDMWNLMYEAIELTDKTEADSATEDTIVLAKGEGVGGRWSRSLGLEMQTAVYRTDRQQFLLPSAGSCTRCPVINRNGREHEKECVRVSLCACVCVVVVQLPSRV